MATAMAIPLRHQRSFEPTITIVDPTFSPSFSPSPSWSPSLGVERVLGSRNEIVPHKGPGTAVYVRQPTRATLKANNGTFASPQRPFYYKDPSGKPFIDIDGKECGPRWILVDPRGGRSEEEKTGCTIM